MKVTLRRSTQIIMACAIAALIAPTTLAGALDEAATTPFLLEVDEASGTVAVTGMFPVEGSTRDASPGDTVESCSGIAPLGDCYAYVHCICAATFRLSQVVDFGYVGALETTLDDLDHGTRVVLSCYWYGGGVISPDCNTTQTGPIYQYSFGQLGGNAYLDSIGRYSVKYTDNY